MGLFVSILMAVRNGGPNHPSKNSREARKISTREKLDRVFVVMENGLSSESGILINLKTRGLLNGQAVVMMTDPGNSQFYLLIYSPSTKNYD